MHISITNNTSIDLTRNCFKTNQQNKKDIYVRRLKANSFTGCGALKRLNFTFY